MGERRTVIPYAAAPLSGQLAPGTTGTPTAFPSISAIRASLSAHPLNSGTAWVGLVTGSATLNNLTGYPLRAGGPDLILEGLSDLGVLYANTDVGGDRICWMLLHEDGQYPF